MPITFSTLSAAHFSRRSTTLLAILAVCLLVPITGCEHFHVKPKEMVYVAVRQMFLRDRVAAVSNRVAQVNNGQALEVLEHAHRFVKVRTEKNEVGWIEERALVDSKVYGTFTQLASQHAQDTVVATATLRDDLYMHTKPGRDTDHLYMLTANTKVQLLMRSSVSRLAPPGPMQLRRPSAAQTDGAAGNTPPPNVVAEDWWLIRDPQGHTGWLLSNRLDVEVPDEIASYAEGQRLVGAYVLANVTDPDSQTPNQPIAEYVTVLSPPKSGQVADFDQVRVFTWSLKHHRYETAFRLRPIQGFLPVHVNTSGGAPTFEFQIADSQNIAVDPSTGISKPVSPRTVRFQLVDTRVNRVGPDMAPIPQVRNADNKIKSAAKKKK